MSWAKHAKEELAKGHEVQIKPRGHSMKPKVHDGDRVTLTPVTEDVPPRKGDVVLVTVGGRDYLHLVTGEKGDQFKIGNMRGHTNGWVHLKQVHGIAVEIEH